jgi:hypothetical protein
MFVYYIVEDRVYRCPPFQPETMERWSPAQQAWVPYEGDGVSVALDGAFFANCPALPGDSNV